MTNAEAIKILNDEKYLIWETKEEEVYCLKANKAINMAIEALEAMDNTQNTLQHVGSVDRPKGHWLVSNVTDRRGRPTGNHRLRCDQCGTKYYLEWGKYLDDYKLCPNCGADMRGESE